jgi:hypothetical protein
VTVDERLRGDFVTSRQYGEGIERPHLYFLHFVFRLAIRIIDDAKSAAQPIMQVRSRVDADLTEISYVRPR